MTPAGVCKVLVALAVLSAASPENCRVHGSTLQDSRRSRWINPHSYPTHPQLKGGAEPAPAVPSSQPTRCSPGDGNIPQQSRWVQPPATSAGARRWRSGTPSATFTNTTNTRRHRVSRLFRWAAGRAGARHGDSLDAGQAAVVSAVLGAGDGDEGAGVVTRLRGGGELRDVLTGGGVRGGGIDLGERKHGDLAVRTRSTLVLVGSFLVIITQLKQTGCAILVAFLQWALFREAMAIVRDEVSEVLLEAEKGGARSLRRRQWGVFSVLSVAVYGRLLAKEIAGVEAPSAWMLAFCRWNIPACAALYVGLLVEFITSLRSPPLIMYQLGQLAAAHFACFLILPSALVSFAARAGLMWFVIPSASVIVNDIMAYICGRLVGRTPLTVLSPKKTREGFVGAALCTSVLGLLQGRYLGGVTWLCSPRNVLLLGGNGAMDVGDIFSRSVGLPWSGPLLSRAEVHAFWIAMLASLVGPFGGFLASGIKRAYGVKDFGDSIPGHGGAGDRFDCQVMLLPLVYFYLKAFEPALDI